MAIANQPNQGEKKHLNTDLLVALGFNLAAWLVVGFVAWSIIH